MTKKTLCLAALAAALLTSVSACSRGGDENLVQVQMSEASYQNLYGAYANTCDDTAGDACASAPGG